MSVQTFLVQGSLPWPAGLDQVILTSLEVQLGKQTTLAVLSRRKLNTMNWLHHDGKPGEPNRWWWSNGRSCYHILAGEITHINQNPKAGGVWQELEYTKGCPLWAGVRKKDPFCVAITVHGTRQFIKNRDLFLTVLEAGKFQIKGLRPDENFHAVSFPWWKAEGKKTWDCKNQTWTLNALCNQHSSIPVGGSVMTKTPPTRPRL
jgi:hypothetical protein